MASRNRVILRTLLSQLLGWLRKGKDGREVMAGKWQPHQELLPLVTQCFFFNISGYYYYYYFYLEKHCSECGGAGFGGEIKILFGIPIEGIYSDSHNSRLHSKVFINFTIPLTLIQPTNPCRMAAAQSQALLWASVSW